MKTTINFKIGYDFLFCLKQELKNKRAPSIKNHKKAKKGNTLLVRKAVSEVIATVILLGITVVGGMLMFAFFQGSAVTDINNQIVSSETMGKTTSSNLKIVGYDARDGENLSGISSLDNTKPTDGFLCSTTCTPNVLPISGGTDFIVLKIRNIGIDSVNIQSVDVNEFNHKQDTDQFNNILSTTSYPKGGYFSIIPPDNSGPLTQQQSTIILPTKEIRLVIKLTDQLPKNINLNESILLLVLTDKLDATTTIIAGNTT